MDSVLLLVVGAGKLLVHPLERDQTAIGRDAACEIALDDRALSRRHAVLRRSPLSLEDLGSTNGIKLATGDILRAANRPLAPGDSFHIGPFSFVVVAAATAEPSSHRSGRERLIVDDPTPEGVSSFVREIARSDINVLIQGETGAGKEVLASTLHALSGRGGPLSSLNCAALSEGLLESELFGHEKGAFTGATATKAGLLEATSGGTVFLDELGEMPLAIQAKLLRAVEAREVRRIGSTKSIAIDVRLIAATNRELAEEIAAGRFREDLYFRLDGVTLRLRPLRERRTAIAPLALRFIEEASRRLGRPGVHASPELLAALAAHDWPGNVRELKATIDRAILLARGTELAPRHLAFSDRRETPAAAASPPTPTGDELAFLDPAQRSERDRIVAALDDHAGNQTRAAKALGISRALLAQKLVLYRIPRPRSRPIV
ncbi:MAG: sigma 54-interacting transcriptional regulator [Kofleriaceae bacterium]